MSTQSSGQWSAGATCRATESEPSARRPMSHATKPPASERIAEPDPCRAIVDSSAAPPVKPWSVASAYASAA